MNKSEQINELAEALSTAQGELKNPEKKKEATVKGKSKAGNDYNYTYKYADLADVVDAIRETFAKHGLSYSQPTFVEGGSMFVETVLMHKSGQWISSVYPVCSINGDHQSMGGSMTYSRRYALLSVAGIVADEDTDGAGAAAGPENSRQTKPQQPKKPEPTQVEVEAGNDVKAAVMACKTVKALDDLGNTDLFTASVKALPESIGQMVRREWSDRKAWLSSKEKTEVKNDELTGSANAA